MSLGLRALGFWPGLREEGYGGFSNSESTASGSRDVDLGGFGYIATPNNPSILRLKDVDRGVGF